MSKIDGVNWVSRKIPTANGTIDVEGLTVRALIKALQQCDPDDIVMYMAEMTPETRQCELLIGVIAGTVTTESQAVALVGPEAVRALKELGKS